MVTSLMMMTTMMMMAGFVTSVVGIVHGDGAREGI